MGIGVEEEPREKPVKSDGAHAARPSPTPAELDAQDPIEGGDDSVRTPPSAEPAAEPETSAEDAPSPRLSDVYARSRMSGRRGGEHRRQAEGPVVRVRLGSTLADRPGPLVDDLEVRERRARRGSTLRSLSKNCGNNERQRRPARRRASVRASQRRL